MHTMIAALNTTVCSIAICRLEFIRCYDGGLGLGTITIKKIRWIGGVAALILVSGGILLYPRFKLLVQYQRLCSEPQVLMRLKNLPAVDALQSVNAPDSISLGYVRFVLPKEEIQKISYFSNNDVITISMPTGQIGFMRPFAVLDETKSEPVNLLGWEPVKGKASVSDNGNNKQKIRFLTEWQQSPYDFEKRIMHTVPSSLSSLVFMSKDRLFDYVNRMEWKAWMTDGSDCRFLENNLFNAIVVMTPVQEKIKTDIKIFHKTINLRQFIIVNRPAEHFGQDWINTFISHLIYNDACDIKDMDLLKQVICSALNELGENYPVDIAAASNHTAQSKMDNQDAMAGLTLLEMNDERSDQ